jgi:hypothetical protein
MTAVVNSTSYDTHRQALSKYNSTHITRHAATSPAFNTGISKVLLIKSDFSEELKNSLMMVE